MYDLTNLHNDLIKINSLMLQAVLDDVKLDKVIGVWDLSESIQTSVKRKFYSLKKLIEILRKIGGRLIDIATTSVTQ